LERPPWSVRYLQGLIDVPYLNLTPGTRSGIVHDERYGAFAEALVPLERHLNGLIDAQRRAEEEQANQQSLRAIQRAFREALLVLPREEYDWFDIQLRPPQAAGAGEPEERAVESSGADQYAVLSGVPEPSGGESAQRQFFDYAGPLYTVVISPAASTLRVNQSRPFVRCPAIARAGGSSRT
jgi:hypothetical protein